MSDPGGSGEPIPVEQTNALSEGAGAELGGGVPRVMAATFQDEFPKLPVAAPDDPMELFGEGVRYLIEWLQAHDEAECAATRPRLFVYSPTPRVHGESLSMMPVRLLAEDAGYAVGGRVFVITSALADGYRIDVSDPTPESLGNWVVDSGLGNQPGFLFLPAKRRVVLYPRGVENEAARVRIPLAIDDAPPVRVETVDEMLKRFYRIYVRTPQGYARLWSNPYHRVPVRNAEMAIELLLLPFAINHFHKHVVRSEDVNLDGRADISISPRPIEPLPGSAVLKLKVLRSKHFHEDPRAASACSHNENLEGVAKGVVQVYEYRDELSCELAFLCCYDMRDNGSDDVLTAVRADADSKEVYCRRFMVHASAEEARRPIPIASSLSEPTQGTPGAPAGRVRRSRRREA